MKSIIRITYFLSFFLAVAICAQTEPYRVKNITLETGIANNTVYSILQDSKGYMWFGTSSGLNRYDGYDFKIYTQNVKDSSTLSDNGIQTVFEDSKGILWIGTVSGYLNRFDRNTGLFIRFDLRLSDQYTIIPDPAITEFPVPLSRSNPNSITSIQEDKKGNLWIGTWGTGIIRFDKRTNRPKRYIEDLNSNKAFRISKNNIKSILIDSDGNIWIASMLYGLRRMNYDDANDKIRFVRYDLMNGRYKQITTLAEDKYKNLYIGTFDGGFFRLTKDNKSKNSGAIRLESILETAKIKASKPPGKLMTIISDKTGIIWLGTYGALLKYDPAKNEISNVDIKPEEGKETNRNVLSLYEDNSGIVWVGFSLGGGILKIENSKVKFGIINKKYPVPSALDDETVWAIHLDKNNVLWAGTEQGGLNRLDLKSYKNTSYTKSGENGKSISDNCIRAIKEDKWGDLWLGTYSGGLNYFNKSTGEFRAFKTDSVKGSSLSHNQVQAIYIDSTSTFWVGTFGGGLNKFQLKGRYNGEKIQFTNFRNKKNDPFSISSDLVYTIYEDKKGTIWIGTFGGGLNKFDKKTNKFVAYRNIPDDESSIEDDRVLCIMEDTEGNLWVATYGGGLNMFDTKTEKFIRYYNENMNVVYAVMEDEFHNLWLSSDKGIFKFIRDTQRFVQYHIIDGLQGNEFSGGAYFKSAKGEMFFGGTNGINHFYPKNIKDKTDASPVVVTNIKVFNESLKGEKEEIELSYSENFISFEFACLDFMNPADNKYAYMLEGYDENWIYTNSKTRVAYYRNLSPGSYRFKVRGTNSDDVWNLEGASVRLVIKPLYWQTTWFRILAVLAFIGILYYLFTLRYKGLLEIEKLKTKIAADLHDNVGAGLTEISILSEITANLVSAGTMDSSKNLNVISEKSRGLVDSMSDIVWVVNPKRDSLYDLIVRLKDSYSDTLSALGIAFKTNNLEAFSLIKLPMDYKQNLYLIFKEALNNSIKHSKCRQISLDAVIERDKIQLILTDDGAGFDIEAQKRGNGLANIKNRTKIIGGILELASSDSGTSLKFTGKIKKADKLKLFFRKF